VTVKLSCRGIRKLKNLEVLHVTGNRYIYSLNRLINLKELYIDADEDGETLLFYWR
jgi:hypothetical protein